MCIRDSVRIDKERPWVLVLVAEVAQFEGAGRAEEVEGVEARVAVDARPRLLAEGGAQPVSYTHLDVYKRQAVYCTP